MRPVSAFAPGGRTRLPTVAATPPPAPPPSQIQVLRPPLRRAPVSVLNPFGSASQPLILFPGSTPSSPPPDVYAIPHLARPVSVRYPGRGSVIGQYLGTPPQSWDITAEGWLLFYGAAVTGMDYAIRAEGTVYFGGTAATEWSATPPNAPPPPPVLALDTHDGVAMSQDEKRRRLKALTPKAPAPRERDKDEVRRELLALMDSAEQRLHEQKQGAKSAEIVNSLYQARQAGPLQMMSALEQSLWLLTPEERAKLASVRTDRREARRRRNRHLVLLLSMMD